MSRPDRIDMCEYQEKQPWPADRRSSGYVGHERGQLSESGAANDPTRCSFDEIEKAHFMSSTSSPIWTTAPDDGKGRTVDSRTASHHGPRTWAAAASGLPGSLCGTEYKG